jgi:hypothetical protein
MKLNLKGRRFDTIEEIQAESQRVFDTLTEKNFQEAFQKRGRRWDRYVHAEENYFEGDGGRWALWRVLRFLQRQSSERGVDHPPPPSTEVGNE